MTDLPVAFEISIANVDKPDVGAEEARHRLGQFAGHAPVWLTRAPRFIDKARLFPGATFAIGVDTAVRLLDPSYYDGADAMRVALETIAELGCRFLVGGRADDAGRFLTLADLAIPEPFREIFADIPPDLFRWDVSSSALRNRGAIWDTP